MKINEFTYYKSDKTIKSYKLLTIKDNESSLEGISLGDLPEEEQKNVIAIYEDFETKLQPYMKNYRRFNKASIIK